MGYLRQALSGECAKYTRAVILATAVARVIKSALRFRLRTTISHVLLSEAACRRLVADFFNEILFERPAAGEEATKGLVCFRPLTIQKELERKFPAILSEEEKKEKPEEFMKNWVDKRLVLFECLDLSLMRLSNEACAMLASSENLQSFALTDVDIVEVCARVRHVHYLLVTDAMVYQSKARKLTCLQGLNARDYALKGAERAEPILRLQRAGSPLFESALEEARQKLRAEFKGLLQNGVDSVQEHCSQAEPHTRRIMMEATTALQGAEMSWGLCPMTSLVFADVYRDLAYIERSWKKVESYFKKVHELIWVYLTCSLAVQANKRFARAELLGGAFAGLYEQWGNSIVTHAGLARHHGQSDSFVAELLVEAGTITLDIARLVVPFSTHPDLRKEV